MMGWIMIKPLALSREQSEAVHLFGSDIGLSASAGSGKTTVLVEKYLEALKTHQCTPQHILAVTFTDKAAGSMKQRLSRRCRELGLYAVARELENAWIGTLHSFCARLLRENPVECGVDPQFQILTEGEQELWMGDILEALYQESANHPARMKLLVDYGENTIFSGIRSLYEADRAHARDERLLETFLFKPERQAVERQMAADAQALISILNLQKPRSESQCRQLESAVELLRILTASKNPAWERHEAVQACLDELKLTFPKTKPVITALKEAGEKWALLEIQALGVDTKKTLVDFFKEFRARYEAKKREKAMYDFEDLLFLTYRALFSEAEPQRALRKRIQTQFNAIFVDEYQDTSHLQAKILNLIKRPSNLFVVGDALQSIYGFRHASPELFEQAMQQSQQLELRENYRSRREILDFVNALFSQIFTNAFRPMSAKRKHSEQEAPCIEWIAVPKDKDIDLDSCRIWEARTIASRIRQLIDSGMRYKDIAILFRKTTSSRIFEKELEAANIPYFVHKGRGFFERLEIMDITQLLRTLDNPHEDIPLAAVLRSPFVQLSDDALFWVSRDRKMNEESYYDALMRWEGISQLNGLDRLKIARFMVMLSDWKRQKNKLKLSQLMRLILKQTAYEAKILTQPDGETALGNIYKLLEMAESYEEKNPATLAGFVRLMQRMSESDEAEPEARLASDEDDVVRILTVHAAKGLEFPCVILADLGGPIKKAVSSSWDSSPETGIGLKIRKPDTFSYFEDFSLAQIRERRASREAEEQNRLLYVAMTRAKDHLILSGVNSPKSWTEKLAGLKQMIGMPVAEPEIVTKRNEFQKDSYVRKVDALSGLKEKPQAAAKAIELLKPLDKPYQMLEDVTVSDVLRVVTHDEIEMLPTAPIYGDEELPRNEFGTLFHKLMELSVRSSRRGFVAPSQIQRLTKGLSIDQKKEMEESFVRFWKTSSAKEILSAKRVQPELPFIYKTPYGLLKGQIDLLYETAGGEWVVLDYKTNRIQPEELEKAAKRYEWQLGLYALIFRELYGKMPSHGILYFSSINKFTETVYTPEFLDRLSKELMEIYPKVAFS